MSERALPSMAGIFRLLDEHSFYDAAGEVDRRKLVFMTNGVKRTASYLDKQNLPSFLQAKQPKLPMQTVTKPNQLSYLCRCYSHNGPLWTKQGMIDCSCRCLKKHHNRRRTKQVYHCCMVYQCYTLRGWNVLRGCWAWKQALVQAWAWVEVAWAWAWACYYCGGCRRRTGRNTHHYVRWRKNHIHRFPTDCYYSTLDWCSYRHGCWWRERRKK